MLSWHMLTQTVDYTHYLFCPFPGRDCRVKMFAVDSKVKYPRKCLIWPVAVNKITPAFNTEQNAIFFSLGVTDSF